MSLTDPIAEWHDQIAAKPIDANVAPIQLAVALDNIGLLLAEIARLRGELEKCEGVARAAQEVANEIERMELFSEPPGSGQIAWWRSLLREALRAGSAGEFAQ